MRSEQRERTDECYAEQVYNRLMMVIDTTTTIPIKIFCQNPCKKIKAEHKKSLGTLKVVIYVITHY